MTTPVGEGDSVGGGELCLIGYKIERTRFSGIAECGALSIADHGYVDGDIAALSRHYEAVHITHRQRSTQRQGNLKFAPQRLRKFKV